MENNSNTVEFAEVFGTNVIGSSAELLFATYMARLLNIKGYRLSLHGCYVTLDNCTESIKIFFNRTVLDGMIETDYTPGHTSQYTDYDIGYDLSIYDLEGFTEELEPGIHLWEYRDSYERVLSSVGSVEPFTLKEIPQTICYIFVNHIVDVIIGSRDFRLIMDMRSKNQSNPIYYQYLTFWLNNYPNLRDYIQVEIDPSNSDYDYNMFLFETYNFNKRRHYTLREKRNILVKEGIAEGAILVLWTRKVRAGNLDGAIVSRVLVRYDGLSDDRSSVRLTAIPEPTTLEERKVQYYSVDEDKRSSYMDMLRPPAQNAYASSNYPLITLGIEGYMYDEALILTKLESDEMVEKLISVDGENIITHTMSAADAIYWVLKQWGTAFDENLFKEMYFDEHTVPLYDSLLAS